MMRRVVLFLCMASLFGCSDSSERSHLTQNGPAMENLASGEWRFNSIDGKPSISGSARMAFESGRVNVQAGCNRLAGPWHIDAERLVVGPLDQSETSCPQSAWAQGNAVSALLAATPHITLGDRRMVLRSSGHSAVLVRAGE